jgi:hypothetical protein
VTAAAPITDWEGHCQHKLLALVLLLLLVMMLR